ncbi:MAG TPA: sigma-70 family RNA polymerase sigma factor [Verrucomicrobiae bacterium]|jgi:RNA polymerase sigma-70 factor (ECF subfamily)|nr:sigma-70 family RNA polymerase sigma factor [Verrucomicrobiae bacterium]
MNLRTQIDFVRVLPIFDFNPTGSRSFLTKPVNEQETKVRDAALLRRIVAKDRDAFAEFYDNNSTLLFSIACKILNDAGEAEDVLQETFVQIWEKAGNFDPRLGHPLGWAVTLVRNRAIDRLRASRRRNLLTEEASLESAVAANSSESANESVGGREKAKLIHSAMVELPAEQRRAIELAFFSGLTQNEISEALHEPLGTIKARIRRGLLKLRDQLEGLL